MKNAHRRWIFAAAAGAALMGGAQTAKAFMTVGDDAALFATGIASAAYNDNLFLSHANQKSDEVFDLIPGLSYQFGQNGQTFRGEADGYLDFQLFAKHSGFNTVLPNLDWASKYDDTKTKINLDASYHVLDLATINIVGTLVKRDVFHADLTGEESVTEKSSVGAGVIFDDTNYKKSGYANLRSTAIPLNYYYEVEPKLDVSAGFRFRNNTVGGSGIDSRDYYYNVGARGEFTPLLTGEIDVGYNTQQMARGSNHNGLGADASLTYAYSEKTNLILGVKDDFSYGADGRALREEAVNIGFNSTLVDQWLIDGTFSYGRYSYFGNVPVGAVLVKQADDFYALQAGVSYLVSTNLKLRGAYTYQEDRSNIAANSFKGNIFSVSAAFSY